MHANRTLPDVPIVYLLLTLQLAEERGVARAELLKGTAVSEAMLVQPDARIPAFEYGRIMARALRRTGDAGLGYEYGLRSSLTSHGLVGLGFISHPTLREALAFADKYFVQLRTPGFTTRVFMDGEQVVAQFYEAVPFGPIRTYAFDLILAGLTQVLRLFVPMQEMELWFECDEPSYYHAYRDRLPPTRFNMGANQIRCPAAYLDRPSHLANLTTVQLVTQECDKEMAIVAPDVSLLARVRHLLRQDTGVQQMDLVGAAEELGLSPRTFKRRLQSHGFTFRELQEEARRETSTRLLSDSRLSIDQIGRRVGYSARPNFTRAFQRWTGTTPGAYRAQAVAASRESGPD